MWTINLPLAAWHLSIRFVPTSPGPPYGVSEGSIEPPDGPGLGIELGDGVLRKYPASTRESLVDEACSGPTSTDQHPSKNGQYDYLILFFFFTMMGMPYVRPSRNESITSNVLGPIRSMFCMLLRPPSASASSRV